MTDPTEKHRKPYPRIRRSRKTVFTPAIWARWMVENGWLTPPPDEKTLQLRAGIREFRHRLRTATDAEVLS
jgi:hypothetical protein